MRIVYLSNSAIPSRTANSIHVMKMCQAFARAGHRVALVAPDNPAEYERGVTDVYGFYGVEPAFSIRRLPLLPVKPWVFYGLFAALYAKWHRPGLAYGRDRTACYFASLLRVPLVFESHMPDREGGSDRVLETIISSPMFWHLVVITDALGRHYSSRHPLLSGRIVVAPDGADPVPVTGGPVPLAQDNARIRVGYTGHLYPGKGMEVISRLVPRCPWADFHIIGGTEEDIRSWKKRIGEQDKIGRAHV